MTHSPKDKKLSSQEIESIELAVEQVDIRAIHPDKMEAFADHLVQKLQNEENSRPTVYRALIEVDNLFTYWRETSTKHIFKSVYGRSRRER